MRSIRFSVGYITIATPIAYVAGTAMASSSDRVASIAQVTTVVKMSISVKPTPSSVEKTLKECSSPSSFNLTGPSTFGACDPYNSEALALKPKPYLAENFRGTKTIFFAESTVTCLTVHTEPLDRSLHYMPNSGYYGSILSRDIKMASALNVQLINTSNFFGYSRACSAVIGDLLVYSDIDHVTIAYTSFASKAVTSAILATLK